MKTASCFCVFFTFFQKMLEYVLTNGGITPILGL